MTNDKAYIAQVKQHGQMYYYYGSTAEQARSRAQASTLGPLWETIMVFKMPEAVK